MDLRGEDVVPWNQRAREDIERPFDRIGFMTVGKHVKGHRSGSNAESADFHSVQIKNATIIDHVLQFGSGRTGAGEVEMTADVQRSDVIARIIESSDNRSDGDDLGMVVVIANGSDSFFPFAT